MNLLSSSAASAIRHGHHHRLCILAVPPVADQFEIIYSFGSKSYIYLYNSAIQVESNLESMERELTILLQ